MAENNTDKSIKRCSFCGRNENQVLFLIPSPIADAYICDDCVDACDSIISDQFTANTDKNVDFKLLTPMEIKAELDAYVIGQDEAKKALAVAVYNHYKRISLLDEEPKKKKRSKKSNYLDH